MEVDFDHPKHDPGTFTLNDDTTTESPLAFPKYCYGCSLELSGLSLNGNWPPRRPGGAFNHAPIYPSGHKWVVLVSFILRRD
ncbi:hypothetical protein Pint_21580 [Pistacia integerrima]|uniref:Uncharacterized protein n=2 Tax=Pistacia TaxID=55512 RepID=A0ACC0ZYW2_9ROSI|nr:hypothetical protein Pint_21580 [Pistacia integerrima]KAJ0079870.1 hypothetical protein Patl1_24113 [Pistacia atlantica]